MKIATPGTELICCINVAENITVHARLASDKTSFSGNVPKHRSGKRVSEKIWNQVWNPSFNSFLKFAFVRVK